MSGRDLRRSRGIYLLVGAVALVMLSVAAEFCYRVVVKGRIRALEREVLERHPGWTHRGTYHARFGEEVDAPVPSLAGDLFAWLEKICGRHGKLTYDIGGWRSLSHAYALLAVHLGQEGEESSHVFLWSPRLRRFVHTANWGLRDCGPSCPWAIDPRQAGLR